MWCLSYWEEEAREGGEGVMFFCGGREGAKPGEKHVNPLIHFFHRYMSDRLNRDLNNSKCLDLQSSVISLLAHGSSRIYCTAAYREADCSALMHN